LILKATRSADELYLGLLEENLSDEEQTDKALTLVAGFSRNPIATRLDSLLRVLRASVVFCGFYLTI
jgi:hypothetical protein